MRQFSIMAAAALAVTLAGCGGSDVKETLGIDRKAPDEFRVVSRPPLSVPPQFNLRPPEAGEAPVAGAPATERAQSVVFGASADEEKEKKTQGGKASADGTFLQRAGAANADPTIRKRLTEERMVKQDVLDERAWWEKLSILPEKPDPLVDAKKESERIDTNEKEGKPVDSGETPTVKPRDRGILGRILGD